jgi:hypothetical protein
VRGRPRLTSASVTGSPNARRITGSHYPAGAEVTVCQAPAGRSTCPSGAPRKVAVVDWRGRFSARLSLAPTVSGKNCRRAAACVALVPDRIWGRVTGRPVAKVAVRY